MSVISLIDPKCMLLVGGFAIVAPGHASAEDIHGSVQPFVRFTGVWTLQNDEFHQVWDGETLETVFIQNHLTRCSSLNTDYSVLCKIDAGELNGHILWVAEDDGRSVRHLSHFGTSRVGVGSGEFDKLGNLSLRVEFADEPPGTYRTYSYDWRDQDTYEMMSIQFDSDDSPTGNWYGGVFVRATQIE